MHGPHSVCSNGADDRWGVNVRREHSLRLNGLNTTGSALHEVPASGHPT